MINSIQNATFNFIFFFTLKITCTLKCWQKKKKRWNSILLNLQRDSLINNERHLNSMDRWKCVLSTNFYMSYGKREGFHHYDSLTGIRKLHVWLNQHNILVYEYLWRWIKLKLLSLGLGYIINYNSWSDDFMVINLFNGKLDNHKICVCGLK